MTSKLEASAPPVPPRIGRRFVVGRGQALGLSLLFAIPLLALFGVFGDRRAMAEGRSGELSLQVDYPMCARHGDPTSLRLLATGPALAKGGRVIVTVSAEYLANFTDLKALPPIFRAPGRGGGEDVAFELRAPTEDGAMPEDGAVSVTLELTPAHRGWVRGWIRADGDSGEVTEVALKTFVFP